MRTRPYSGHFSGKFNLVTKSLRNEINGSIFTDAEKKTSMEERYIKPTPEGCGRENDISTRTCDITDSLLSSSSLQTSPLGRQSSLSGFQHIGSSDVLFIKTPFPFSRSLLPLRPCSNDVACRVSIHCWPVHSK